MEKPWLSQYPEGVPAEIDISQYQSVLDVFRKSCRKYADRKAFMRTAGNGNTTCEQLTLKPDFPPAAYEGVAQLAPADGKVSFSITRS